MSDQAPKPPDELIPISLPAKYWVILVAAVDQINQQAIRRVEELRKQGVDQSTLSEPMVTALAGPAIIRGLLVKELTARGVMTPEANQQFGIDKITEQLQKFRDKL